MSFTCDACQRTFSAPPGRADWPKRCPRCGGPLTFIGLTAEPSPNRKRAISREAPIALTRAEPAPRRGPGREWVLGGGVIAVLLLALLGMSWALVSHARTRPDASASAAAATPSRDQPEPRPAAPVIEPRPAEVVHLPIPSEPPDQERPTEEKPPLCLADLPTVEAPPASPAPAPAAPEQVTRKEPQPQPQHLPPSATFMGVKAPGKRFCIIADCSGSMAFNNRMVRLKKEMASTLKALSTDQEFFVIFFNTSAIPMPARSWRRGGRDAKRILPWIGGQVPLGGTEPMPAFERAFRLKPRPDAIYFLTDGLIPASVPAQVARLNGQGKDKVPIHTILFGGEMAGVGQRVEMVPVRSGRKIVMVPRKRLVTTVEKDEGQLEQISRDSGGTHRFVPDTAR
jgi:hypothetical protein